MTILSKIVCGFVLAVAAVQGTKPYNEQIRHELDQMDEGNQYPGPDTVEKWEEYIRELKRCNMNIPQELSKRYRNLTKENLLTPKYLCHPIDPAVHPSENVLAGDTAEKGVPADGIILTRKFLLEKREKVTRDVEDKITQLSMYQKLGKLEAPAAEVGRYQTYTRQRGQTIQSMKEKVDVDFGWDESLLSERQMDDGDIRCHKAYEEWNGGSTHDCPHGVIDIGDCCGLQLPYFGKGPKIRSRRISIGTVNDRPTKYGDKIPQHVAELHKEIDNELSKVENMQDLKDLTEVEGVHNDTKTFPLKCPFKKFEDALKNYVEKTGPAGRAPVTNQEFADQKSRVKNMKLLDSGLKYREQMMDMVKYSKYTIAKITTSLDHVQNKLIGKTDFYGCLKEYIVRFLQAMHTTNDESRFALYGPAVIGAGFERKEIYSDGTFTEDEKSGLEDFVGQYTKLHKPPKEIRKQISKFTDRHGRKVDFYGEMCMDALPDNIANTFTCKEFHDNLSKHLFVNGQSSDTTLADKLSSRLGEMDARELAPDLLGEVQHDANFLFGPGMPSVKTDDYKLLKWKDTEAVKLSHYFDQDAGIDAAPGLKEDFGYLLEIKEITGEGANMNAVVKIFAAANDKIDAADNLKYVADALGVVQEIEIPWAEIVTNAGLVALPDILADAATCGIWSLVKLAIMMPVKTGFAFMYHGRWKRMLKHMTEPEELLAPLCVSYFTSDGIGDTFHGINAMKNGDRLLRFIGYVKKMINTSGEKWPAEVFEATVDDDDVVTFPTALTYEHTFYIEDCPHVVLKINNLYRLVKMNSKCIPKFKWASLVNDDWSEEKFTERMTNAKGQLTDLGLAEDDETVNVNYRSQLVKYLFGNENGDWKNADIMYDEHETAVSTHTIWNSVLATDAKELMMSTVKDIVLTDAKHYMNGQPDVTANYKRTRLDTILSTPILFDERFKFTMHDEAAAAEDKATSATSAEIIARQRRDTFVIGKKLSVLQFAEDLVRIEEMYGDDEEVNACKMQQYLIELHTMTHKYIPEGTVVKFFEKYILKARQIFFYAPKNTLKAAFQSWFGLRRFKHKDDYQMRDPNHKMRFITAVNGLDNPGRPGKHYEYIPSVDVKTATECPSESFEVMEAGVEFVNLNWWATDSYKMDFINRLAFTDGLVDGAVSFDFHNNFRFTTKRSNYRNGGLITDGLEHRMLNIYVKELKDLIAESMHDEDVVLSTTHTTFADSPKDFEGLKGIAENSRIEGASRTGPESTMYSATPTCKCATRVFTQWDKIRRTSSDMLKEMRMLEADEKFSSKVLKAQFTQFLKQKNITTPTLEDGRVFDQLWRDVCQEMMGKFWKKKAKDSIVEYISMFFPDAAGRVQVPGNDDDDDEGVLERLGETAIQIAKRMQSTIQAELNNSLVAGNCAQRRNSPGSSTPSESGGRVSIADPSQVVTLLNEAMIVLEIPIDDIHEQLADMERRHTATLGRIEALKSSDNEASAVPAPADDGNRLRRRLLRELHRISAGERV